MSAVNVKSVDGAESESQTAAAPKRLSSLFHLLSYLKPYKSRWIAAMAALLFTASLTLMMGQGVKLLIDSGFGEGSLSLLNQAVLVLLVLAFLMSIYFVMLLIDTSQFTINQ